MICKCGQILTDENFDYINTENEVGEDYCIYEASCPTCEATYETQSWGHCHNPFDAIIVLEACINEE